MKVSETWLREWVNPPITTTELVQQLTMAGLEIDDVSPVAGAFSNVVVAYVVSTTAHPSADRLTLCQVQCGDDSVIQVVCGASNVRPGLKVALAEVGACLPGPFKIKASKLRGEMSFGMLCSAAELGLAQGSEGILELPEDAPIGHCLREYFRLNDHVFSIELTPNRSDCLSIRGIAREVAALNSMRLSSLADEIPQIEPLQNDVLLSVQLNAKTACPFYLCQRIDLMKQHELLPCWITEKLRRAGMSVIHPVVDLINYVMMERGQPMHAFDADCIEGALCVRYAVQGETLLLLNDQEVTLDEKVLVIADDQNVLAIAGVMGGKASAVTEKTRAIVLESAYFDPVVISGVARRFGLHSESAVRFERGVDPAGVSFALTHLAQKIVSLLGGRVYSRVEAGDLASFLKPKSIAFRPERVFELTGLSLSAEVIETLLKNLSFKVEVGDVFWTVSVPTYRVDVSLEVDLVEEVLRLYGYDALPRLALQKGASLGSVDPVQKTSSDLSRFLMTRAYSEVINYSFVDPAIHSIFVPDQQKLTLLNPISSELSEMRMTLWPGLLASLLYNVNRQKTSVRCFEVGTVFHREANEERMIEIPRIAGLIYGRFGELNWSESVGTYDFFDMKGDLEACFSALKMEQDIHFERGVHMALHPGKSAKILYQNTPIGWVGALHPEVTQAFSLLHDPFLFELDLSFLIQNGSKKYQPISKFPAIRRDLALLVPEQMPAALIEKTIRKVVSSAQLKQVDYFDDYQGSTIPTGMRSLGMALTFQNEDHTFLEEEITELMNAILKELEVKLDVLLREL